MLIRQTRIYKLETHLGSLAQGQEIILAAPLPTDPFALSEVGFATSSVGQTVLPAAKHGPACRFNCEGRWIIHRDQPRDEPYYREVFWHWTERHGDREIHREDFKEVMRFRYRRAFVPPPGCEVRITQDFSGNRLVTSGRYIYGVDSPEMITHNINVMLELFGVCQVLDQDLNSFIFGNIERVNWRILPEGHIPWERLRPLLQRVIEREPPGNRKVIEKRFELLNELGAERIVVGEQGFAGYVVFSFPRLGYHVFESVKSDNATYFFGADWQELSRMTKAEIIEGRLYKHRVIHRLDTWQLEMRHLLRPPTTAA